MDFIKFESREKTNKFLNDPILGTIELAFTNIYAHQIPIGMKINDDGVSFKYSPEVEKIIEEIQAKRDEYIKIKYYADK